MEPHLCPPVRPQLSEQQGGHQNTVGGLGDDVGVGHPVHPQLEREVEVTEEGEVQQDGEDHLEEETAGDGLVHHHQLGRDQ